MANYVGRKWLYAARYITDDTRLEVERELHEAKLSGYTHLGVRCGTYVGGRTPVVVITHGAGMFIYRAIYQEGI